MRKAQISLPTGNGNRAHSVALMGSEAEPTPTPADCNIYLLPPPLHQPEAARALITELRFLISWV